MISLQTIWKKSSKNISFQRNNRSKNPNEGLQSWCDILYLFILYNEGLQRCNRSYAHCIYKAVFLYCKMGAILFGLFVIESGDVYLCRREYVHILLPFVFVLKWSIKDDTNTIHLFNSDIFMAASKLWTKDSVIFIIVF